MALRKCGGCQKEIGANAAVCPQCGEPAPKRTGSFTLFIGVPFAAIFLWGIFFRSAHLDTPAEAAAAVAAKAASEPKVDQSPTMQAGRKEMIESLQEKGVFGEVKCSEAGGATVVVRPAFYRLDFEQKKVFVSVPAAYCFEPKWGIVSVDLVDSKTNKDAGSFSPLFGLKLE